MPLLYKACALGLCSGWPLDSLLSPGIKSLDTSDLPPSSHPQCVTKKDTQTSGFKMLEETAQLLPEPQETCFPIWPWAHRQTSRPRGLSSDQGRVASTAWRPTSIPHPSMSMPNVLLRLREDSPAAPEPPTQLPLFSPALLLKNASLLPGFPRSHSAPDQVFWAPPTVAFHPSSAPSPSSTPPAPSDLGLPNTVVLSPRRGVRGARGKGGPLFHRNY